MNLSRKIVIVYEKMGMGHLRMARILEDMLKGDDIEIQTIAASELLDSSDVDGIVNAWNSLIRKNLIKTADISLNFLTRIFGLPFLEITQGIEFQKILEDLNPDIIICTADGFNKAIGTYAYKKGIPFYIFITEISIFIDLVNPYATHICYFDETVDAIRNYDFDLTYYSYQVDESMNFAHKMEYISRYLMEFGLNSMQNPIFIDPSTSLKKNNNAKCHVLGPLAEKKHFVKKNRDEISEKLGFDENRQNVLIVSGSIGGKFLLKMVNLIDKAYKSPITIHVMCGKDELTRKKMQEKKPINSNVEIIPYGYINNFDEFMTAADCLIARPSAGIFIESLLNSIPMVTFSEVTSNDKGSLTMIEKYNIGEICNHERELVPSLEKVLNKRSEYVLNINNLIDKYCVTYEEKKKLLREVILENHEIAYGEEKRIFMQPVLE